MPKLSKSTNKRFNEPSTFKDAEQTDAIRKRAVHIRAKRAMARDVSRRKSSVKRKTVDVDEMD